MANSIICRWLKLSSLHSMPGSISRLTLASCNRAARCSFFQFNQPKRENSSSRPMNRFSATDRLGRIDCSW
ncbi:hypothetical protein D3C75_1334000 [compost metagenome]